ncbi:hypothetical protein GCM10023224_00670 [Streptomonospora halophila]|uniref:Uncharacterized protein n=1 Tax=Streptomonospora halophila TaxID=427369 RepID=A0ABP9G1J1_9ACTN
MSEPQPQKSGPCSSGREAPAPRRTRVPAVARGAAAAVLAIALAAVLLRAARSAPRGRHRRP